MKPSQERSPVSPQDFADAIKSVLRARKVPLNRKRFETREFGTVRISSTNRRNVRVLFEAEKPLLEIHAFSGEKGFELSRKQGGQISQWSLPNNADSVTEHAPEGGITLPETLTLIRNFREVYENILKNS